MNDGDRKLHAVFLPVALQGHIRPAVNLAIDLASRGITITFVNIRHIHLQLIDSADDRTDRDIFEGAREAGLDIRYEIIDDGLPVEYDRMKNLDQHFKAHIHVFPAHVDFVLEKIVRRSDPPVNFLIVDTFYTCSTDMAKKYGLVNVSFWTEPALVLWIYHHMDSLERNGHYACRGLISFARTFYRLPISDVNQSKHVITLNDFRLIANQENRKDTIGYIPGVHAVDPRDLPSYLQDPDASNMNSQFIRAAFDDERTSDIVIINTIQELEAEVIASMSKIKPTYAIGPISLPESPRFHISTTIFRESDCTEWLDTNRERSVLYISFGSFCGASEAEMGEIAHGVLLSGVNFLWVIRADMARFLPDGFRATTEGRGLIVLWCDQNAVISHPAIGGFLTHCGWNSVLESIRCEVPLICYPLFSDQFTNRRLVVDEFGIGINLCDGEGVSSAEVAEKISQVMEGSVSNELRKNIKERKKAVENAAAPDGSSRRNVRGFIDCVQKMIRSKELQNKLLRQL